MKLYIKINELIRSQAFRTAGIYTFSNFFAKATAFLLLFIYSNPKYISVHENGLLSLLSSSVYILMPFLSLGIIHSTSVEFFKLKKNEFTDLFTTSFVMPVITMFAGMILLYVFKDQLNTAYGFPVSFVILIPVMTFLAFCNEQYITLIRNNEEPYTYFKASMLRLFIEISISIALVVGLAWRWEGRVTGIMVANIVLLLVAVFYFFKKGYFFGKIRKSYLKDEIVYALPIIVMQFSMFCMSASDKFFLSYYSDNNVVGVYGYACVFATVITIACSAIISFVMPKIYKALSDPHVNFSLIRKYFMFYLMGCFLAFLGTVLLTPIMYRYFINDSYAPGLEYMYLIAIGYFIWSITYFFYSFMLYKKEKSKILLLSIFSIAISLICNYVFIRQWNAMGAAISVCTSYFIVFIVTLLISRKYLSVMFYNNKNNYAGSDIIQQKPAAHQ